MRELTNTWGMSGRKFSVVSGVIDGYPLRDDDTVHVASHTLVWSVSNVLVVQAHSGHAVAKWTCTKLQHFVCV